MPTVRHTSCKRNKSTVLAASKRRYCTRLQTTGVVDSGVTATPVERRSIITDGMKKAGRSFSVSLPPPAKLGRLANLERACAAEARRKAASMCRRPGVLILLGAIVHACRASTCWPDGAPSNRQTRESWHRCDCHPRKILVVRSITSCRSVTTLPQIYCAGKRSYTYKTTPDPTGNKTYDDAPRVLRRH